MPHVSAPRYVRRYRRFQVNLRLQRILQLWQNQGYGHREPLGARCDDLAGGALEVQPQTKAVSVARTWALTIAVPDTGSGYRSAWCSSQRGWQDTMFAKRTRRPTWTASSVAIRPPQCGGVCYSCERDARW